MNSAARRIPRRGWPKLVLLDGYVRVSQVAGREGERFISPGVQREKIEGWARLHGARIGEVFEELDESGGRTDRPLLEQALTRVEQGESAGIVVAKIDRFGRSLTDGLAAIDRVTRAGGTFVSVEDGLDLSTDTGRLVLRLLLSLAEWELDRVRTNWTVARARAIARGVHVNTTPIGYRKRKDGRLGVEATYAPLVSELFRRRAAGARICELVQFLDERGLPTACGAPHWTPNTVSSVLRNRVYLGELRHGPHLNPAAHPPIVDAATWQAAQWPLEQRQPIRYGQQAVLGGLLRCSGCRRMLTTYVRERGNSGEHRGYSCIRISSRGRCPSPVHIKDSTVEPYMEALFWQELRRVRGRSAKSRVRAATEEVERKERELAAYRDSRRLLGTLGIERFEQGLAVRSRRLERALLALAAARRAVESPGLPPPDELEERWRSMAPEERRDAIAKVIDCAFVLPGRGGAEERLVVCLRGEAPDDLPLSRPRCLPALRPLDRERCRASGRPRVGTMAPWSESRLRAELGPFLEGRTDWPAFPEFQKAGLAIAHAQLALHGGAARWAQMYGLRYEPRRKSFSAWSDERVRRELREFLGDRTTWPTSDEFAIAGRRVLRDAVTEFGGPERWAAEFGLPLPPRQQRSRLRWTDEETEAELRKLTAGMTSWPPRRVFDVAGLRGLYMAIQRRGSRPLWARRLGLKLPKGRVWAPARWTQEAMDAALRELIRGRDTWPTREEFNDAGLDRLYQLISRLPGGHDRCARRYGLTRRTAAHARAARRGHELRTSSA